MRVTFEMGITKYRAHMIISNFSKLTIRNKGRVHQGFCLFLSRNHPEVYQDFRSIT